MISELIFNLFKLLLKVRTLFFEISIDLTLNPKSIRSKDLPPGVTSTSKTVTFLFICFKNRTD